MTREEAINQLQDAKDGYQEYLSAEIIDMAIKALEQEPKTGHWQNNACSNCGIYNASAYKNWCPNCGAKMVEQQESEDKK